MEVFNLSSDPVLSTLFALAASGVLGLLIGNIKIWGIRIGITGALFSGIILSHLGIRFNEEIIHFLREFGLVLFVYAVGIQVGNGFFSSFRKNGILLNLAALLIVFLNLVLIIFFKHIFFIDPLKAIGLYCGAVTNTPALASAQGSILSINHSADISVVSSAYAISYPGAIFAIIVAMILLKRIFSVDPSIYLPSSVKSSAIINRTINVENPNLDGVRISEIPAIDELNIIVTRIKRGEVISIALADTFIKKGDKILAVGSKENLDKFEKIVGSYSDEDLINSSDRIINTRVIVTNKDIIGKKISETKIPSFSVIVTRVTRSDVEFLVSDDYEINFADQLVIVGEEDNVKRASLYIGNSPKELNHPDLVPIFIGIVVGIIIGLIPFSLPFTTRPLKLGLAGGLLISAIIFSNLKHIGKISWYIPPAANIMIRELGIVIFLSCVGLKSGNSFFSMITTVNGFYMICLGFIVSFLPVFVTGFLLLKFYKQNFLTVCGLMSGAMTDPPALAWAQSLSESPNVSMAYASVYPFTMFLRITTAQILVFLLYG